MGLSIIFSENFLYSSCVQKSISLALALPILPTLAVQPVEFHSVIENGTELIVQGFEIHRRIRLAALIPTFDHLILPSDNVFGLDRIHFSLGEVREQFGANDVLLGVPGVLFQPILHIGCLGVDKALKCHIQIGFYLVKLFPLPSKRLSFRRKATLC